MWTRNDVVFTLKSPLHIGYLPFKGSVISPTRYYILGKNLWGAITKRVTESLFVEPKARDYQDVGKAMRENFKFSYFYFYDGQNIYVPNFTDNGLKFGDKKQISVVEFEHKFIGSRVSTAIESLKGKAKDESLHEIEFINDKYKEDKGNIKNIKLIGCIWLKNGCELPTMNGKKNVEIKKNGIFMNDFDLIKELTLGGEQKYGFGLVELESINKEKSPIKVFQDDEIKIKIEKRNPILSHLKYDRNISFQGEIELLSGREYPTTNNGNTKQERYEKPGFIPVTPEYYFSPGTVIENDNEKLDKKLFILKWDGTMEKSDNK